MTGGVVFFRPLFFQQCLGPSQHDIGSVSVGWKDHCLDAIGLFANGLIIRGTSEFLRDQVVLIDKLIRAAPVESLLLGDECRTRTETSTGRDEPDTVDKDLQFGHT